MRPLIFFLRVFSWFSLRQVRQHPWRAATVLAGVALGAAVFGSVRLAVHASLDTFGRSMDVVAGRADHTVTRPGGRVDEALVVRLLAHPAVRAASPFLSTYTRARDGSGEGQPLDRLATQIDHLLARCRWQRCLARYAVRSFFSHGSWFSLPSRCRSSIAPVPSAIRFLL